jgi:hypothetical protein
VIDPAIYVIENKINGKIYNCVEWDVKEYLKTHDKCIILPKDTIMGVETRILSFNNKIC